MLCPVCGTYATDDEIVCQRCGKLLERAHSEDEELLNTLLEIFTILNEDEED